MTVLPRLNYACLATKYSNSFSMCHISYKVIQQTTIVSTEIFDSSVSYVYKLIQ